MPEMEVEFEVLCECGNGLCGQTRVSHNRLVPQVIVEPCEKCMNVARGEGHAEGHDEGYQRAKDRYQEVGP